MNANEGTTRRQNALEFNRNKALENSQIDDFDVTAADELKHFDNVIWMGDFNYRI